MAKPAPITQTAIEKTVILLDHNLEVVQACAWALSIGHGRKRARYCMYELKASMINEAPKTISLFSEIQMS